MDTSKNISLVGKKGPIQQESSTLINNLQLSPTMGLVGKNVPSIAATNNFFASTLSPKSLKNTEAFDPVQKKDTHSTVKSLNVDQFANIGVPTWNDVFPSQNEVPEHPTATKEYYQQELHTIIRKLFGTSYAGVYETRVDEELFSDEMTQFQYMTGGKEYTQVKFKPLTREQLQDLPGLLKRHGAIGQWVNKITNPTCWRVSDISDPQNFQGKAYSENMVQSFTRLVGTEKAETQRALDEYAEAVGNHGTQCIIPLLQTVRETVELHVEYTTALNDLEFQKSQNPVWYDHIHWNYSDRKRDLANMYELFRKGYNRNLFQIEVETALQGDSLFGKLKDSMDTIRLLTLCASGLIQTCNLKELNSVSIQMGIDSEKALRLLSGFTSVIPGLNKEDFEGRKITTASNSKISNFTRGLDMMETDLKSKAERSFQDEIEVQNTMMMTHQVVDIYNNLATEYNLEVGTEENTTPIEKLYFLESTFEGQASLIILIYVIARIHGSVNATSKVENILGEEFKVEKIGGLHGKLADTSQGNIDDLSKSPHSAKTIMDKLMGIIEAYFTENITPAKVEKSLVQHLTHEDLDAWLKGVYTKKDIHLDDPDTLYFKDLNFTMLLEAVELAMTDKDNIYTLFKREFDSELSNLDKSKIALIGVINKLRETQVTMQDDHMSKDVLTSVTTTQAHENNLHLHLNYQLTRLLMVKFRQFCKEHKGSNKKIQWIQDTWEMVTQNSSSKINSKELTSELKVNIEGIFESFKTSLFGNSSQPEKDILQKLDIEWEVEQKKYVSERDKKKVPSQQLAQRDVRVGSTPTTPNLTTTVTAIRNRDVTYPKESPHSTIIEEEPDEVEVEVESDQETNSRLDWWYSLGHIIKRGAVGLMISLIAGVGVPYTAKMGAEWVDSSFPREETVLPPPQTERALARHLKCYRVDVTPSAFYDFSPNPKSSWSCLYLPSVEGLNSFYGNQTIFSDTNSVTVQKEGYLDVTPAYWNGTLEFLQATSKVARNGLSKLNTVDERQASTLNMHLNLVDKTIKWIERMTAVERESLVPISRCFIELGNYLRILAHIQRGDMKTDKIEPYLKERQEIFNLISYNGYLNSTPIKPNTGSTTEEYIASQTLNRNSRIPVPPLQSTIGVEVTSTNMKGGQLGGMQVRVGIPRELRNNPVSIHQHVKNPECALELVNKVELYSQTPTQPQEGSLLSRVFTKDKILSKSVLIPSACLALSLCTNFSHTLEICAISGLMQVIPSAFRLLYDFGEPQGTGRLEKAAGEFKKSVQTLIKTSVNFTWSLRNAVAFYPQVYLSDLGLNAVCALGSDLPYWSWGLVMTAGGIAAAVQHWHIDDYRKTMPRILAGWKSCSAMKVITHLDQYIIDPKIIINFSYLACQLSALGVKGDWTQLVPIFLRATAFFADRKRQKIHNIQKSITTMITALNDVEKGEKRLKEVITAQKVRLEKLKFTDGRLINRFTNTLVIGLLDKGLTPFVDRNGLTPQELLLQIEKVQLDLQYYMDLMNGFYYAADISHIVYSYSEVNTLNNRFLEKSSSTELSNISDWFDTLKSYWDSPGKDASFLFPHPMGIMQPVGNLVGGLLGSPISGSSTSFNFQQLVTLLGGMSTIPFLIKMLGGMQIAVATKNHILKIGETGKEWVVSFAEYMAKFEQLENTILEKEPNKIHNHQKRK